MAGLQAFLNIFSITLFFHLGALLLLLFPIITYFLLCSAPKLGVFSQACLGSLLWSVYTHTPTTHFLVLSWASTLYFHIVSGNFHGYKHQNFKFRMFKIKIFALSLLGPLHWTVELPLSEPSKLEASEFHYFMLFILCYVHLGPKNYPPMYSPLFFTHLLFSIPTFLSSNTISFKDSL